MKGYSLSRDPLSLDTDEYWASCQKMTSRQTSLFLASWLNIEAEYLVIMDHDKMNNPILHSACNNPFFSHKQALSVDKWSKINSSPIKWASLLSFELRGEKVPACVKTSVYQAMHKAFCRKYAIECLMYSTEVWKLSLLRKLFP